MSADWLSTALHWYSYFVCNYAVMMMMMGTTMMMTIMIDDDGDDDICDDGRSTCNNTFTVLIPFV